MKLSNYTKILFATTAMIGMTSALPAYADNVTPTAGADATRSTSTSTTGYTVVTGNDNSVNTGNTTAFIMDGTTAQQNLTVNSGVTVTAANADTVSITAGNNPNITLDSGSFLTNTGTGSVISAGAINLGTATLNLNGTVSNTGGGSAIDFSAVTGGIANITISGPFSGSILGGAETDNLTIGNADLSSSINTGAGTDSLSFTGGAHTNAISNVEALSLSNSGTSYTNGTAVTGLTTVGLGAGTVLNANQDITATGALTYDGRLNIANGHAVTVSSLAAPTGAGSIFGTTIGAGNNNSGQLVIGGAASMANTQVAIVRDSTQFVANNTSYTIVDGVGAATLPTAGITDNSFVHTFTLTRGGAGNSDIILTAIRTNSYDTTALNSQNRSVGTALETLGANGTGDLRTIQLALDNMGSAAPMNNALETLTPAITGVGQTSMGIQTAILNNVDTRLESFRDQNLGIATGDDTSYTKGVWAKGFGVFQKQGMRDGIAGYDADTGGITVGADTEKLLNNAVVGVAATYANSNLDGRGLNQASTDIDSYEIGTYLSKIVDPKGDNYYVKGQASFGYNRYDENRNIAVGGFTGRADGDYNGYQVSARLAAGKDYGLGDGFVVTPEVSAQYSYLYTDSYTETGAGGASLRVGNDSNSALIFGAGGRLAYVYNADKTTQLVPEVRAKVFYNALNDSYQVTNNFVGGGPAFETNGIDASQASLDLGASLSLFQLDGGASVRLDYDAEMKSEYIGHNVQATVRYDF